MSRLACLKGEKLVANAFEYEIRKRGRLLSDGDQVFR